MADPWADFRIQAQQAPAADPWADFRVEAQSPIQRPAPIPRPGPVERPMDAPARQRTPGRSLAPPAAMPGADATATGMAEEPTAPGAGRFAKPDGSPALEAPRGVPSREEIRKILDGAPPDIRKKVLKEWADAKVKEERSQGGMKAVNTWIDDRVRTLARGTPVGSWLDEANAAAYNLVGVPYDEQLAYERAKDEARDSEASTLATVPTPLGDLPVTTSGLEKLAGGLASTRAFPGLTLMQGASLIPRTVNATATGAAYGGLYGAGEGDTLGDRAVNSAVGTLTGGALGSAIPVVQNAVTGPINSLARYMNRPGVPVAGMDRRAVTKVAGSMEQDGVPAAYAQRRAELGPEGMLADMGDNLRMDAARLARNPGEARSTVINALDARRQGSQGRITAELDDGIGAPLPVPQTVEQIRQTAYAQARPFYDEFYQTPIPYTQELVTALQRVPQSAWQRAAQLAEMEGVNLQNVMNTGRGIDLVKRAVDDIASGAEPGSNLQRISRDLSRNIRNATDDILSPGGTPQTRAQSPWAQARRLAGNSKQFEEAVDMGRGAFSRNLSPDQMRVDRGRLGFNQQAAYDIAARDQVRQIAGNASSAQGSTGDNAVRRALGSDNAREKLELIAGPRAAQNITRRLDAESTFARTQNDATANSITSTMNAAAKKWPAPDGGAEARAELIKSSLQGQAMALAHRIVNSIRNGAVNERLVREQADAARMLVAQGADRDAIVGALIRFSQRQRLNGQRSQAIERVIRDLMQAPRGLAVQSTTSE